MIEASNIFFHYNLVADLLSVSKTTLKSWDKKGFLTTSTHTPSNQKGYYQKQIEKFPEFQLLLNNTWDEECKIKPLRPYKLVELFAGAGGLALGMEKAGFNTVLLNEIDNHACSTLRKNRPSWNIVEGDVSQIQFKELNHDIDIVTGGFPCQSFSYAGKKLGFNDIRGTLFFEFARAINELNPKVFMAENVKGLLSHDNGTTLQTIKDIIENLGYVLVEPKVLKAIFYKVPQKRERLILIGIRKDLFQKVKFKWPSTYKKILTVQDALKKGELFSSDVPVSEGSIYPEGKAKILKEVPEGGYWRDLPENLQKEYMKKSYFLGGGKTGMARRLSWSEPSLTLTCAPSQKQTERCHPSETRPLQYREYARIQTFPDEWSFEGPLTSKYKQIGNAVPVNLATAIGRSLIALLNDIEKYNA